MSKKRLFAALALTALISPTAFAVGDHSESKAKDSRQGIRADRLLKGEIQNVTTAPQQTSGDTAFLSNLFKPTLEEWLANNKKNTLTPTTFVREGDTPTPDIKEAVIEEVADLSRFQYFYKESLHAELKGKRAAEILQYTHAKNGKVYVSTTIDKVYPEKKYIDDETNQEEKAQCIDILTRITVTNVPLVTEYGLDRLVDFWQDIKSYQCHTNSPED